MSGTSPPPRILAIAGSDSSGGAGIQADIKTITMLGGYAMTAVTVLTAQNTLGVTRVDPVDPEMVAAQIEACISDIGIDAVKIGMLGSAAVAEVVAERLSGLEVPIVFDPVMVATSGAALADAATVGAFERLMRLATLTTPNIAELAALGGDAAMATRRVTYLAKGGD
ncbi:MAG TPA: bifunctional hydroxymethylpyrimidine kinase/phosphomethylpyrimidine kinase, partial [Novosphingobium sp.]|nr:bifunctional hydroxymethylpyrimidine kinase/phosphomethylpyrimidine kinase [Novosphingobium sp.]